MVVWSGGGGGGTPQFAPQPQRASHVVRVSDILPMLIPMLISRDECESLLSHPVQAPVDFVGLRERLVGGRVQGTNLRSSFQFEAADHFSLPAPCLPLTTQTRRWAAITKNGARKEADAEGDVDRLSSSVVAQSSVS